MSKRRYKKQRIAQQSHQSTCALSVIDCLRRSFLFIPFVPDILILSSVSKQWHEAIKAIKNVTSLTFKHTPHVRRSILLKYCTQSADSLVQLDLQNYTTTLNYPFVHQLHIAAPNLTHLTIEEISDAGLTAIFQFYPKLKELEVHNSSSLRLPQIPENSHLALEKLQLHGCESLSINKARKLLGACSIHLKMLCLTGNSNIDSTVLHQAAISCQNLSHITLSQCGKMRKINIDQLFTAISSKLQWLDLSYCSGFTDFSGHPLHSLEVLILDKTEFNDNGLRIIGKFAPNLLNLSLQRCSGISDVGICAVANPTGCPNLKSIDLLGTKITEKAIEAIENFCPLMKRIVLDSCRGVPRAIRMKYSDQACRSVSKYERFSIAKNKKYVKEDDEEVYASLNMIKHGNRRG